MGSGGVTMEDEDGVEVAEEKLEDEKEVGDKDEVNRRKRGSGGMRMERKKRW